MAVYKPKGRKHWYYSVQAGGVRLRGSTRCTAKAAALRVADRKLKDLAAGRIGPNAPQAAMTAQEAFARYWAEKAQGRPSEADTLRQLDTLQTHFGAGATLAELTDPDRISDFIAKRRGEFRRVGPKAAISDRHVSDATVNREVELLRRVLRRAQTVWQRDTGPLPDWKALLLPEPEGRTRELSAEEEAAVFRHLRRDYHPPARFALMMGLRLAPIITLTKSQVDWQAGEIRVRLKSKRPGGEILVLPLTPAARALLQSVWHHHPIYVFTYVCRKSGGGYKEASGGRARGPRVKPEDRLKEARRADRDQRRRRVKGERYPFSRNGWRKPWGAALAAAGVEDFRFHDTRHTAATRLLRASNNLAVVKRFLGHRDIASTLRYAHVLTEDLARAMETAAAPAVTIESPPAAAQAQDPHKKG